MITEHHRVIPRLIDCFMMILISICAMNCGQYIYSLNGLNLEYWNKIINFDVLVEEGIILH